MSVDSTFRSQRVDLVSLQHGPCAFIASVLACATMDGWNPSLLPLYQQNLSSLETRLGVPVGSDSSQRSLSEAMDDMTLAALFATSSDPQRTIILSSSSPQASKVWSALPSKSRYHIPASQFTVAVRFRMGCVFPTSPPSPCTVCGINMDAYGRHLLTHRRYQIHNAVRDSVADFCKEAQIPTITEPPFASTARAGNQLRPPLIFSSGAFTLLSLRLPSASTSPSPTHCDQIIIRVVRLRCRLRRHTREAAGTSQSIFSFAVSTTSSTSLW